MEVDCSPGAAGSVAELQMAIGRQAEKSPAGSWLRGWGYDDWALAKGEYPEGNGPAERHPTRQELDTAAPHHPVRLVHPPHHLC